MGLAKKRGSERLMTESLLANSGSTCHHGVEVRRGHGALEA
ncbi:MAG: hypothetical protein QXY01_06295 [Candidatus Bathyarchaeia archaeon]